MSIKRAFPYDISENTTHYDSGMELRDYFAAKALPFVMQDIKEDLVSDDEWSGWFFERTVADMMAETAYLVADAMMKMRDKV